MDIIIEEMKLEHLKEIDLDNFDDFWNINILNHELSLSFSFYIIAKYKESIVGFAGINIILDEAHLANIVVRKDMRGQKIGEKLLETLINTSQNKLSSLTLEVNENNIPAINLYKKYGFKTIRKTKKIL